MPSCTAEKMMSPLVGLVGCADCQAPGHQPAHRQPAHRVDLQRDLGLLACRRHALRARAASVLSSRRGFRRWAARLRQTAAARFPLAFLLMCSSTHASHPPLLVGPPRARWKWVGAMRNATQVLPALPRYTFPCEEQEHLSQTNRRAYPWFWGQPPRTPRRRRGLFFIVFNERSTR